MRLLLRVLLTGLGLFLLAACGADVPETVAPETADFAAIGTGRTAEGAYFLGRDDAPVTLTDYSDFL